MRKRYYTDVRLVLVACLLLPRFPLVSSTRSRRSNIEFLHRGDAPIAFQTPAHQDWRYSGPLHSSAILHVPPAYRGNQNTHLDFSSRTLHGQKNKIPPQLPEDQRRNIFNPFNIGENMKMPPPQLREGLKVPKPRIHPAANMRPFPRGFPGDEENVEENPGHTHHSEHQSNFQQRPNDKRVHFQPSSHDQYEEFVTNPLEYDYEVNHQHEYSNDHEYPPFPAVHSIFQENKSNQPDSSLANVNLENPGSNGNIPGFNSENTDKHKGFFENQPLTVNLASLLAEGGTIAPRNDSTIEPSELNGNINMTKTNSQGSFITRTSIPKHFKSFNDPPEYYDDLYEEFVDLYYDPEGKTEGTKRKQPNPSTHNPDNIKSTTPNVEENITEVITTQRSLSEQTPKRYFDITTVQENSTKGKISSVRTITSELPASTSEVTSKSTSTANASRRRRPPPISLSEVLQELGLTLPQFLGTLIVHGSSLKEFTTNLQTKHLSKIAFRRAKGNVKILLEILEGSSDRHYSGSTTHSSTIQSSTSQSYSTTTNQPTKEVETANNFTLIKAKKDETLETISKEKVTQKPRVFGSRPSNIEISQLSKEMASIATNTTNMNISSSKFLIPIELDLAEFTNNTDGVNTDAILHSFKTMFNISEKSLQNQNVNGPIESKTKSSTKMVSLRPYRPEAEKPHPRQPFSFDRVNGKIYRRVVSNRLSSTARPTLRPPYIPKPPSINYEEIDKTGNIKIFGEESTVLVEDTNGTPRESNQGNDLNEKKNYRDGIYNYNTVNDSSENLNVSTKSAIMAAGILGGVALSVFIAIFIVVKYRNHRHKNKRRIPLALPSDSSSSSFPPIYASRSVYSKECYQTSGFWTTLKKRFDPYSPSASPTSIM